MTEAVLSPRALNRALLARQGLLERSAARRCRACSSGWAGCRRSTRRRCTSGCGRGSTGFERDALTRALEARERDPGDADAQHDPPRLRRGLLAARGRRPRGAPRRRGCGPRGGSCRAPPRSRPPPSALRAALAGGATLRRKEIDALIGKAARARRSASGSTSSARRRRARGSAAAPTSTRSPRTGSGRADVAPERRRRAPRPPLPRRLRARHGARTSPPSPACRRATSPPSLERLELRRFRSRTATSCSTSRARPLPDPDTPGAGALPRRPGTRACSCTRAAPACSPRSTARGSSTSKAPQSFPTFLVDGAVAGTWRYEKGAIELSAVRPARRRRPPRARGRGRAPRGLPRVACPRTDPLRAEPFAAGTFRRCWTSADCVCCARSRAAARWPAPRTSSPTRRRPSRSRSPRSSARPARGCSSAGRAASC